MKSIIYAPFLLGSITNAIPAPVSQDPSVRILPGSWRWDLVEWNGPGCPDEGSNATYITRPGFGSNTVDGSEIYYWHFAYPHLKASIGHAGDSDDTASTWCETTLKYTELQPLSLTETDDKYRLRLHKNGTEVIAMYTLDEGVTADWKFTYYYENAPKVCTSCAVVDKISAKGPLKTGSEIAQDLNLQSPAGPGPFPAEECGTSTFKYRIDLALSSTKAGAKGKVSSLEVTESGKPALYGVQPGVSYDFEKCD
ncbi:hypothetical protein EJ04DRAFT_602189 [Polyplosphaeria fusca]|uniref:Uncharacterized protein n=1 Tax=Polyplosphaeria fusca TaxID=682080 RepID=A0A9P4QVT3_9PLEO|nr:hypothetical protein EJ04DRAFT_602189 [Polyplosphaeria fusca]